MDQKTQEDRVAKGRNTTECARCGLVAQGLPLTWVCCVEDGAHVYFCDTCARDNIRSIEGRLESAWW